MANAVEANNLSVSYNGFVALHNLSFSFPEGKYIAIVGPNGSGKTTLLKVILNMLKPSSGTINIFGKSRDNIDPSIIGYVPQFKTIDRSFPATALELVLSGLHNKWITFRNKKDTSVAMEVLESVGAAEYSGKQLSSLSGGQLQRVYLARCFVRNPKIILLDEPATGVDLVCESSVNSLIEDYNKRNNATVIMVTHDWSAAYHHTELVLLLNKSLVYIGSSKDAFTDINLQRTFSHLGHNHKVTFGLKGSNG